MSTGFPIRPRRHRARRRTPGPRCPRQPAGTPRQMYLQTPCFTPIMTKLGWPSLGEPGGVAMAAERSADHAVGVHGRAAELTRIGRFLDEVASHPAALLIEGEPGIGKTALWSAGIDLARRRGWHVLTCRPVQPEAALSFSAL